MAEKSATLASFANVKVTARAQSLEDVEGMELKVTKVEVHKGDFSPYVIFTATSKEGAIVTVRTSNRDVIQAMTNAVAADALPVTATFIHDGSKWCIG